MNDKYVFVSGASGGIGKATSIILARNGFHVFAGDIAESIYNDFSDERIIPIQLDITSSASIENATEQIKIQTSYLNGIVNIAGTFDQFPLVEAEPLAFEKLINVNLIGHQSITKALFPLLLKAKGKVINLSSETVLAQMPLQSYGFSKKLFDVWNTQLRMELGLLGMKVIVIRAGGHQTPFIKRSYEIIGNVNQQSKFANLMQKIKLQGQRLLEKKQGEAMDLATIIFKILSSDEPKKVYHVNVSLLFRILSIFPSRMRENLMTYQLKKWM